ncbi:MAG: N-acetyltransferase [Hyphomicrobiaceae bacterium]|nr:N-acetyltransferase [Hyphomicrobiaceae bacterium]
MDPVPLPAAPVPALPADSTLRPVSAADLAAISELHAAAFGPGRFVRTAYRVREGSAPISAYCRVAVGPDGMILAALRFTPVSIGGKPGALLLGPLAVRPTLANQGYGRALIAAGLEAARAAGVDLVVLVGDMPYYARFGFSPVPPGRFRFPGPVNPARILACALRDGAVAEFAGLVAAVPQS